MFTVPFVSDLNIAIPKKFLLFSGPHSTNISPEGYPTLTPGDYVPIFKMYGVSTIIRLNKKCYERKDFINSGFAHFDLYHTDGSTPSNAIAEKFIQICEQAPGTVAVHCKAGLGRTGTCIGLYIMKHYHFSAAETIAWLRLCRPGCVIGPQQHYLKLMEPRMWKLGKLAGVSATASSVASGMSVASTVATNGTTNGSTNGLHESSTHTPSRISSSDGIHHPAPTPSYSLSQPSSPANLLSHSSNASTPSSANSGAHPSYSQSFDTMPTLHQQKVGQPLAAQYRPSSSGLLAPSPNGASASSSSGSGAYPHTRSAARAAVEAAQHTSLNPMLARGRAKSRTGGGSPTQGLLYADDAKDTSASSSNGPLSAPQALRSGSTAKSAANGSKASTEQRSLFDQKSWMTSPTSPLSASSNGSPVQRRSPSAHGSRLSPASPNSPPSQRRSPSANGLRRGPTSPLATNTLLNNTLAAASVYGAATVVVTKPSTAAKRSSSRETAAIPFRQTKLNGRAGKV